jgi:phosphonatase-like hydrolase
MLSDHLDLVALDMAGTTLAVADEVPAALGDAFAESGIVVSREAISRVRGRSKAEAIRTLLGESKPGAPADDDLSRHILLRFQQLLRGRLTVVQPVEGARGALEWIHAQGVAVVLTTGFDRGLAAFLLDRVGWAHLPDGVVTGDDVSRGRPDPEVVFRAMDLVGAEDPRRVAVVGDTVADLEAGRAAGAGYVIGVLTGAHGRDSLAGRGASIVASVAELPAWLEAEVR